MAERFDVVVVGCGPAGGSTALAIARNSKKSILVLEQKSIVGGDKARDTGGMSVHQLREAGIEPPKEVIAAEIEGAKLYTPDGTMVDICLGRLAGWVTRRERFDRHLIKLAQETGNVEVRTSTRAYCINQNNGRVTLNCVEKGIENFYAVEADKVVIATGPNFDLPNQAGLNVEPADHDILVGIEDTIVTDKWDQDHIHIMFDTGLARGGYVWSFAENPNRQRFGLGTPMSYRPSLREMLQKSKEHFGVENCKVTMRTGGRIPCMKPPKKVVSEHIAIIGGCAGHIDPLTGGGDGPSMIAGKFLGETIAKDNPITDYENWYLHGDLGRKHRRNYRLRMALWRCSNTELNWIAKRLKEFLDKEKDLDKRFRNLPYFAMKVIMRKPQLLWRYLFAGPVVM